MRAFYKVHRHSKLSLVTIRWKVMLWLLENLSVDLQSSQADVEFSIRIQLSPFPGYAIKFHSALRVTLLSIASSFSAHYR